jgi:heterodisulfide reductase subunit A2
LKVNSHNSQVLIIGGGIAGLTAAAALSRLDISVTLIEKTATLGGMVRHFCCKAAEACQQCGVCLLNDTLQTLNQVKNIEVFLETKVTDLTLDANKFLYTFSRPGGGGEGRAEVLLLATGFTPFRAEDKPQYRYGILPNVITGLDLEKQLQETDAVFRPSDHILPASVAFIQCFGSRDLLLKHPFCSQVCCAYALRMANLIKHKNPQTDVTIFYMDIQTFGKDFSFFLERSEKQIRFIRAIPGEIQKGEKDRVLLTFQGEDGTSTQKQAFDLAVLSVGIMPGPDHEFFQEKLGLPVNADGFLDQDQGDRFSQQGIFMAGTVRGPKSIAQSIIQANKAVEEVVRYLKHGGLAKSRRNSNNVIPAKAGIQSRLWRDGYRLPPV